MGHHDAFHYQVVLQRIESACTMYYDANLKIAPRKVHDGLDLVALSEELCSMAPPIELYSPDMNPILQGLVNENLTSSLPRWNERLTTLWSSRDSTRVEYTVVKYSSEVSKR